MKPKKNAVRELSYAQLIDLLLGWKVRPGEPGSNFSSMDEAKAAYHAHRDELWTNPGTMSFAQEYFGGADEA